MIAILMNCLFHRRKQKVCGMMGSFYLMISQDPREEVIQAWYMDDSDEDQRFPHHREPKQFVSLDQLASKHLLRIYFDNVF